MPNGSGFRLTGTKLPSPLHAPQQPTGCFSARLYNLLQPWGDMSIRTVQITSMF